MTLTKLRTGRTLEAQFNPPELEASMGAVYQELEVLGWSGKPIQFKHSSNLEMEVSLMFDRLTSGGGGGGGAQHESNINFLWSLPLPMRGDSVSSGGPSDVLFVWPKLYSVVCRVTKVSRKDTRFAFDGRSTLATVNLTLTRFSEIRILSEDVERDGWRDP